MRREGYIIEEIVDYSNMAESFDQVLRGTKRKRSRQGRYLLAHREEVIEELTERIADGSFQVNGKWVRLNVAKEVKSRNNGKKQVYYFLYSVNDIIE